MKRMLMLLMSTMVLVSCGKVEEETKGKELYINEMKIKYNISKNRISYEDKFVVDMDEDDETRADRSVCIIRYAGEVIVKEQKIWTIEVDSITLVKALDGEGGNGVWCEKYIEEKRAFILEGNIMKFHINHEDVVKFLNQ